MTLKIPPLLALRFPNSILCLAAIRIVFESKIITSDSFLHMDGYVLAVVALILGLYVLKGVLFGSPQQNNLETVIDPENDNESKNALVFKDYTPRELSKFNGFDNENIFIAVRGKVYNVTKGRKFYGPSGPYSNFAGHDASRGLALNSFELDVVKNWTEPMDKLDDLSEAEIQALDGWEKMFSEKYTCVGNLVADDEIEGL